MSNPTLPLNKYKEQEILHKVFDEATNSLVTSLATGDIELGSVELKNGTDDSRAVINDANTTRAATDHVLLVQQIDASGAVVAGSASPMPSNYVSPTDGSVAYTSSTTVTCSGFPFTVDDANCTVSYIQIKPTGSTWGAPKVNGVSGVSLVAGTNIVTIAGAGTPFASGDTYRLGIRYQDKSFNAGANSLVVTENNPNSLQVVEESLVDTTNVAAGTVYYPSSLGMAMMGYKDFSLTGKLIDTDAVLPMTVEVTNDEDATNADWIQAYGYDLKNNTTVNSITASSNTATFALTFNELNVRYIRTKIVPTDSSNTVVIKARRKA